MSKKIGLYGGFFNPFHKGHLHVIKSSIANLNLQKLIVLPTYQNPLKSNQNSKPIKSQLSNIRSQINEPLVKVSDFEHRYQMKCTYDVLQKISTKCNLNSFYLIMGLDQLGHFHKWKEYEWILKNISICVIYRPRYDEFIENSTVQKQFPHLFMPNLETFINNSTPCSHILNVSGVEISSSELRNS
jgi:nicotinate-nucleotide adenylyltransferase